MVSDAKELCENNTKKVNHHFSDHLFFSSQICIILAILELLESICLQSAHPYPAYESMTLTKPPWL